MKPSYVRKRMETEPVPHYPSGGDQDYEYDRKYGYRERDSKTSNKNRTNKP